jgi:multiple sugar transport system substrate-binding protein
MRKRLKPFTLFLCIGIVLFMVFGWDVVQNRVGPGPGEQQAAPEEWEGVITLWDYPRPSLGDGSNFGWIRERIREFEKANPGIFIELNPLDWEEGRIQLDLAVSYGTYPDIAPVGGNLGYAGRGVLEPLDEFFIPDGQGGYLEYALKAVSHNGGIWGIPLYGAAPFMLLNLESFERADIAPPENGRWTYEEFVAALQQLTLDGDNDGKPEQYGFGSFVLNGYYNLWGILLSDGWDVCDPVTGRYTVNTPQAVSGLDKLTRLVHEYGVMHEDVAVCPSARAWSAFALDESIAVYPEGAWAVEQLKALQSEGKGFEFGIAQYPTGERGVPVTVGDVAAYGVFRQRDPDRKRVCMEFIRHIVQSIKEQEVQNKGLLPVLRSYGEDRETPADTGSIIIIPRLENWAYVEDIINSHVRQALLGNEEPAEALEAAQREIDILSQAE